MRGQVSSSVALPLRTLVLLLLLMLMCLMNGPRIMFLYFLLSISRFLISITRVVMLMEMHPAGWWLWSWPVTTVRGLGRTKNNDLVFLRKLIPDLLRFR
jgi:uncharacterized membrane-anchored protein YitT (DUF2179 family)